MTFPSGDQEHTNAGTSPMFRLTISRSPVPSTLATSKVDFTLRWNSAQIGKLLAVW